MTQPGDAARWADHGIDSAREMEERRPRERQLPRSERVELDRRVGRLQQPRGMSNVGADELARAERVEAVALDQPFLERTALGRSGGTDRLVARDERPVCVDARVVDARAVARDDHVGAAVREPVERASDADEQRARRVERDEPDAAPVADAYVGAQVQLWNRAEAARRKQAARAGVGHPERNDADPRTTVANVGLNPHREQRAQVVRIHRPVGEEEVVPAL